MSRILISAGCAAAIAMSACAEDTHKPAQTEPAAAVPPPAVVPIAPQPVAPMPPQAPAAAAPTTQKGMPSQQISEEFMKLVMEASAKIEEAKRKIQEREAHMAENDPAIKKLHAELAELQTQINAIVEADPEYANLKLQRDIKATVMPNMPQPPGGPMGGHPMMPPPGMRAPPPPMPHAK